MARGKIRGRKRLLDIKRHPNGKPVYDGPIVPKEAIARRAELIGIERDDLTVKAVELSSCGLSSETIARKLQKPAHEIKAMIADDKKMVSRLSKIDASSALGRLHAMGLLQDHHKDAGLRLTVSMRHLDSASGAPRRNPIIADLGVTPKGPEREPPEFKRVKDAFDNAMNSVPQGIKRKLVECIVIDDIVPPYLLTEGENSDRLKKLAIDAFDDLAKFYRLT